MAIKLIRRRYDLPAVLAAGTAVKQEIELDKGITRVRGILLTADMDNQLYHRGMIGVQINGEEVFPENYQTKLLMSGLGVAPQNRYLPLDIRPGNGVVKMAYTDTENPLQAFGSYNVSVYLELEFHTDEG